MSDGNKSDGSHILYKEVDPYNKVSSLDVEASTNSLLNSIRKTENWVSGFKSLHPVWSYFIYC